MDGRTQRQLQGIVVSAFENIKRELDQHAGPPSIDKLRRVVEFKRGKRLVHDQLPDGYTSPTRMLVEIGHARRIIGTTMQRVGPISLADEARYIAHVVRVGIPITEGPYPPFPKPRNARKHYIKLAHQLYALGISASTDSLPGAYAYQDADKSL